MEPIHSSIVKALSAVMRTVEAVAKSQHNSHGNYKFASTDDIYAAVSRKLGDVGLIIVPLELSHEIRTTQRPAKDKGAIIRNAAGDPVMENVHWLHCEFGFVLATEEATWSDPAMRRSVFVQYTGPQSHQALQSYAEKAMLRSLLKIPTGDMDLDSMPQAETVEDQVALIQPRARKSSAAAKRDGTDQIANEIISKLASATTAGYVQQVRALYAEEWSMLPPRWAEHLDGEYESAMLRVGGREAAE